MALGLGGLAIAGLGALLFAGAWDGYLAGNPGYLHHLASPPPATGVIGIQAWLAVAMLTLGYLGALVGSLVRLRSTGGGWMLLRALGALTPLPIDLLWLRHFFPFYATYICGDCSPPEPVTPDVFALGNNVLTGAVLVGLVLAAVFLGFGVVRLVRTRRRASQGSG